MIPKFYIYLVAFRSMIVHLTTHPAPQPLPYGQQISTKQGKCALCSAPSHHFVTGRPRALARTTHNGLVAAAGSVGALADASGELKGSRAPPPPLCLS